MSWITVLLYLIPVALFGYWLVQRGRRTPTLPPATARILASLAKRGTDPSKPTTVSFLLSFDNRAAAERAARDLPSTWATVISQLPDQDRWGCRAAATMLPAPADIAAHAQELEAFALRHGGEYEGWESGV
jgi:hypothetical protein